MFRFDFLQFSCAIVKKFFSGGQLGTCLEFPKEIIKDLFEVPQLLHSLYGGNNLVPHNVFSSIKLVYLVFLVCYFHGRWKYIAKTHFFLR